MGLFQSSALSFGALINFEQNISMRCARPMPATSLNALPKPAAMLKTY